MSQLNLAADNSEKIKDSGFSITVVLIGSLIASQYVPIVNTSSHIIKPQVNIIENELETLNNKEIFVPSIYKYYDIVGIKASEVTYTELRIALTSAEKFIELNEISNGEEGGISMIDNLYAHKENAERFGIIGGTVLGALTTISPLLIDVQWIATIPATIMFFSLPLFIFINRYFAAEEE